MHSFTFSVSRPHNFVVVDAYIIIQHFTIISMYVSHSTPYNM
uniref:Uncharacterized protein n=1 Tax=Arundo donax TaxID=35708 RepID=A0A0A8YKH8_ARUDO